MCFFVSLIFLQDKTLSVDDIKNISPQNKKKKIDLWLYVVKDASVNTEGVFHQNGAIFWSNDCALKGFLPLHCRPPPTCSTLHWNSDLIVGLYVQIQLCASKSVHLRESRLRENSLRGEVYTVVIPVCLHYVRFKGCSTLFTSVKNTAAAPSLWTTFMLIKTVLWWWFVCKFEGSCASTVWLQWNEAVVCLWATECQLFVSLLSRGDFNNI